MNLRKLDKILESKEYLEAKIKHEENETRSNEEINALKRKGKLYGV